VKAPVKPASAKKPTSINLDDNAPKKPISSAKHAAIKSDEAPTAAVKAGGEPVSKATMQPVKRTITLDNNKY